MCLTDLTEQINEATMQAMDAENHADAVSAKADDMQRQINEDLLPKLRDLQGLSSEAFNNASDSCT